MAENTLTPELLPPQLLARLERMELVSRKVFRGRMKGERRSRRKGQSVEFADYRSYVPGDDLRFVDWNLYARLDKLFLKLFLEEEDLHVYFLVDSSPSMNFGQPTKFFAAQRLAAALGFVGMCRGDRVRLEFLGAQNKSSPVLRGRSQLPQLKSFVESAEPDEIYSLTDAIKRFCLRNTGRGIVVLLTDLMEKNGYEPALRMLVGQQMDLFVVHMLSPEEMEPELQGDLKLVDCEDQDEAEVSVSHALLKKYKSTLAAFVDQARRFCSQRDVMYLLARSDQTADVMVGQYLRERGLVR
ncbi:DUF58 domain-containing protein [Aureliella helgolandensis]|uniref:DUF58 domain-containing protein n=1 Tax=Aureliella helgolandensis TaxID=2527968 RepID=A0A518GCI2_9BACT|nr:DUF58 domain-containing protein [Aureliella helgolandensis]QDV26273.1 hypothetical protein Q31a_46450 [Aureliella helgolandensis]